MTVIARNPFTRTDLVRRTVPVADRRGCRWCGRTARFAYGHAHDGRPGIDWVPGGFCSIGCYRNHA